jgi:hypothetical protein
MEDCVLGAAGGVEHFHVRPAFPHLVRELAVVHAAVHGHIGEDQVECHSLVHQLERAGRIVRGKRRVAEALHCVST